MNYLNMSKSELAQQLEQLQAEYKKYQDMGLKLDMSRGKPGAEQLNLSEGLLKTIVSNDDCKTAYRYS